MLHNLLYHRYLIKELSKREITNRYKGSFLGLFLALLIPLAMFVVFAFVFGEIFRAKWPKTTLDSDMASFSINLFIGLSIFWFFSEIISRAPILFSSVPNYIKKVIFPLWILPFVSLFGSLFHLIIYFIIIIIALLLAGGSLHLSVISIPIIIVITFPLLIGISFLLGSLGVYIKDINIITGVVINLLIFLSPVFYPLSNISKNLQWLFKLNPVTLIIEQCRIILIDGKWPQWTSLVYYFSASLLIFFLGYWVFKTTRKGFADVI
jgi:lipopolysaccharide transport system permease protein